jgi:OTU domain-containing protein 3
MRKGAEWGGNLELAAAARCLNRHIFVHQLAAPRLEIRNWDNPGAAEIHMSYHDNEHYSSVRAENDSSYEAADVKLGTGIVPSKHSGSGGPVSAVTKDEEIVMQLTGCRDIQVIREALRDNWSDRDATVEYIIALQVAGLDLSDAKTSSSTATNGSSSSTTTANSNNNSSISSSTKATSKPTVKPKRSDPCPCGSGVRYKKCCMKKKKSKSKNSTVSKPKRQNKNQNAVRIQNLSNKQRQALLKKQREEEESGANDQPRSPKNVPPQEDLGSVCI